MSSIPGDVYLPEIARTSFLKAENPFRMDGNRTTSRLLFRQAASGWKSVTGSKEVESEKLSQEHFDGLVTSLSSSVKTGSSMWHSIPDKQ